MRRNSRKKAFSLTSQKHLFYITRAYTEDEIYLIVDDRNHLGDYGASQFFPRRLFFCLDDGQVPLGWVVADKTGSGD